MSEFSLIREHATQRTGDFGGNPPSSRLSGLASSKPVRVVDIADGMTKEKKDSEVKVPTAKRAAVRTTLKSTPSTRLGARSSKSELKLGRSDSANALKANITKEDSQALRTRQRRNRVLIDSPVSNLSASNLSVHRASPLATGGGTIATIKETRPEDTRSTGENNDTTNASTSIRTVPSQDIFPKGNEFHDGLGHWMDNDVDDGAWLDNDEPTRTVVDNPPLDELELTSEPTAGCGESGQGKIGVTEEGRRELGIDGHGEQGVGNGIAGLEPEREVEGREARAAFVPREKMATGAETKVVVAYYTEDDHMKLMADAVKRGLELVDNLSVEMFCIPAVDKTTPSTGTDPLLTSDLFYKLEEANGIVFGVPSRNGLPPAAVQAFFDCLTKSSSPGELVGKPACLFTSSPGPVGGQETTIWASVTQLAALGMIFVPTGYGFGPAMFSLKEVHGGSPFGAGTVAGTDNKTEPTTQELQFAQYQGSYFGLVSRRFQPAT